MLTTRALHYITNVHTEVEDPLPRLHFSTKTATPLQQASLSAVHLRPKKSKHLQEYMKIQPR